MRLAVAILAAALLLGGGGPAAPQTAPVAAPASPPDPVGDWIGQIQSPLGPRTVGVRIRRTRSGLTGSFVAPGKREAPLAGLNAGPQLSFAVPLYRGSYLGRWNPASGAWTGRWSILNGGFPLDLRRGEIPPAPLFSTAELVICLLLGLVIAGETAAILRLLQLRRRRRARRRT